MADQANSVTITLRGKSFVISTTEPEQFVQEAAQLLDGLAHDLSEKVGVMREDQLMMFAALQSLVAVIKQREEEKRVLNAHADRLAAALDS